MSEHLATLHCGELWMCRNGEDVHIPDTPHDEPVFLLTFDAPENGCYLTMEDVRTLRFMRDLKTLPAPFGVANRLGGFRT